MILYLARNENINLLDSTANDKALHIRKIAGSFSLAEFITMEMRKYASCGFFCVDRATITENDREFTEALESFKMMYSARVIVIYETSYQMEHLDDFTRALVHIGVTDIVTANDTDEKLTQLAECLSDEGMLTYKPKAAKTIAFDGVPDEEKAPLAQSIIAKDMENEQYRFDCVNVTIGIIGATRRVGVTTLALGLAGFIRNHGGTACYAALNTNGHLGSIANAHGFDVEDDYYTLDAIDYYEGMMPKHDYNFVIMDYGDMVREAVKRYKESDVHLFCGASGRLYEVNEFTEALKQIKSVNPQVFTYAPNADYVQFFSSSVTDTPVIVKPVKDMLDFKPNAVTFKGIVQPYIVETSKRL